MLLQISPGLCSVHLAPVFGVMMKVLRIGNQAGRKTPSKRQYIRMTVPYRTASLNPHHVRCIMISIFYCNLTSMLNQDASKLDSHNKRMKCKEYGVLCVNVAMQSRSNDHTVPHKHQTTKHFFFGVVRAEPREIMMLSYPWGLSEQNATQRASHNSACNL